MTREKGKRIDFCPENYVVFDLETTGLVPGTDQIIEISGIKVLGDNVSETFSTLVNPGMHIPYAATRVNGITDKMVRDAPSIQEALADFLKFTGDLVLVGHNIHTFDTNFVYDSALLDLGRKFQNDYVDTLYLSRNCLPQLHQHKLTDIAAYFELGKLYVQKLAAQKQSLPGSQEHAPDNCCPECGRPLVQRKGRYGTFWGCTGYPMCRYTRKR